MKNLSEWCDWALQDIRRADRAKAERVSIASTPDESGAVLDVPAEWCSFIDDADFKQLWEIILRTENRWNLLREETAETQETTIAGTIQ